MEPPAHSLSREDGRVADDMPAADRGVLQAGWRTSDIEERYVTFPGEEYVIEDEGGGSWRKLLEQRQRPY